MIILTIVRHGESTDNLKTIWAGSSDATLSVHGMNQAKALGKSLANYHVDAIFASNLLRATWTAQQIQSHQPDPKPPLTLSKLFQEQHFGKAERGLYAAEKGMKGFHRLPGRVAKFEGGESLDDVRKRSEEAIAKYLEPILEANKFKTRDEAPHIFVVAHGIFNSEFVGALMARRGVEAPRLDWRAGGMSNTGWTRIELAYADEHQSEEISSQVDGDSGNTTEGQEANGVANSVERNGATNAKASTNGPVNPAIAEMSGALDPPSAIGSSPGLKSKSTPQPNSFSSPSLPQLTIKVLTTNVTTHLDGLKRQQGGIGSSPHDDKQKDIRSFFGGGSSNVSA